MKIQSSIFLFISLLCQNLLAQEIKPFKDKVNFTQDDICNFWDNHAKPESRNYIGVFVDAGSRCERCNQGDVFTNDGNSKLLASLLKNKRKQAKYDFGFEGKEKNVMLTSVAKVENVSTKDFYISNSWNIFKFNRDKDCFSSIRGIGIDETKKGDIFVIIYTYSRYDNDNQVVEYGRDLQFSFCDEHEKYLVN
jgi:hypothetical protein